MSPHAPPLRGSLPPEGADPAWGGPAPDRAPSACLQAADAVLSHWGHDPHALVQVLRETQALTHWLPRALLAHIAQALRLPLAQVEGVATFYRFFHTRPVGRLRVLFSDNITDRMLGSEALLSRLCERLGVAPGQPDDQGRFSVDRCSCTGLCDQGPALLINHHQVITRLDASRVDALAALMRDEVPVDDWPADWFHVHNPVRRAGPLLTGLPADAPACAGAAAPVFRPHASGRPAKTPTPAPTPVVRCAAWSATPTKASPVPSRTARCSASTPTRCSTA